MSDIPGIIIRLLLLLLVLLLLLRTLERPEERRLLAGPVIGHRGDRESAELA
jgi:hypothetical protein